MPIKNVLFLANASAVGGGNQSLMLLASGIEKAGWKSYIIIPGQGHIVDACVARGLKYLEREYFQPTWRGFWKTCLETKSWRTLLRSLDVDIIHANDLSTGRSLSLAAHYCQVPMVCHVRFPFKKDFGEWVFRRLPKPKAFLFNSRSLRAEVGGFLASASPRSEQFVVHNAVDLTEFKPGLRSSQVRRVGILANLLPVKGHKDFIEMASLLTNQGFQAEYWIIGGEIHSTGYLAELEADVHHHGLTDRTLFLGHRPDVAQLLQQLDVLVCCSHVEPFGRCIIEAMACELPVVATRVGGIPEVVEHPVTGILVDSHSPRQLAEAVGSLLQNNELRKRMGDAGRKRAEELFSAETHVDKTIQIYHWVFGRQ